ncbi:MAG: hypothetical protein Q7S11_02545 [bacterium]|nr:hypothetical protein [bacterium]
MIGIIILIIIVVSLVLYLTGLPFELGTGFTEIKTVARKGEYTVNDNLETKEIKNNDDEVRLLE